MGWIKHEGNKCPVVEDTLVWLLTEDGEMDFKSAAREWNWIRDEDAAGCPSNRITHYSTDEVCPGALPVAEEQSLPGMSEREFVQRYVIHLAPYAYGNSITDERCIKWARNAYRAIDEALKGEGE